MIGNWLQQLPDVALERLLTRKCVHGQHPEFRRFLGQKETPLCLVEVAYNVGHFTESPLGRGHGWVMASKYDNLANRFGLDRVNAAIRERCLKILDARKPSSGVTAVTDLSLEPLHG